MPAAVVTESLAEQFHAFLSTLQDPAVLPLFSPSAVVKEYPDEVQILRAPGVDAAGVPTHSRAMLIEAGFSRIGHSLDMRGTSQGLAQYAAAVRALTAEQLLGLWPRAIERWAASRPVSEGVPAQPARSAKPPVQPPPGITLRKEGRRVYIAGNTFPIKDAIRDAGGHWDADAQQWWVGTAKQAVIEAAIAAAVAKAAEVGDRLPEDERSIIGRGTYRGQSYYVLGRVTSRGATQYDRDEIGPIKTRDGERIKLAFRDGSQTFWAPTAEVGVDKRYERLASIRSLREYAAQVQSPAASQVQPPAASQVQPPSSIRTETRVWRGESGGMAPGETRKMRGYDGYRVVVATGPVQTRRLTEMDEDMGLGQEGDRETTQSVTHRPATVEETEREEARLAAVEAEKRQADPTYRLTQWLAQHPGATHVPEMGPEERAITALALEWVDVADDVKLVGYARIGRQLQTAEGHGRAYARMRHYAPDDSRTVYYTVRDRAHVTAEEEAKAEAQRVAKTKLAAETAAALAVTTPPGGWTLAAAQAVLQAVGALSWEAESTLPEDHPYRVARRVLRPTVGQPEVGHVAVERLRALGLQHVYLDRASWIASAAVDPNDRRDPQFQLRLHVNERGDHFVTGFGMHGATPLLDRVATRGVPTSLEESEEVRAAGVPRELWSQFPTRAEIVRSAPSTPQSLASYVDRVLASPSWIDVERLRASARTPGIGAKLKKKQLAALATLGIQLT